MAQTRIIVDDEHRGGRGLRARHTYVFVYMARSARVTAYSVGATSLQPAEDWGFRKTIMRAALLLAPLLLIAACAPAAQPAPTAPPPLRTVRFMAGYKPQANLPFVAVYVAQANGYFAEQGLQAEITHATGQGEHLKLLLQGTLDVITASADEVLARRADALPVVAIAVLGQRDQRAYAVLDSSPIRSVKDWEGRTVGFKVEPAPDYLAMLSAAGVDRGRIQE